MTMRSPLVSVIIPCYNQGQYIDEAVNSVLAQSYQNLEVIIVNDGSSDLETNQILESYSKPKTIVTHTLNQGLPSARNHGIHKSNGQYILPLDADDKIGSTYIEKAVELLEANDNLGIVYCEAELFGDQIGKWDLPKYKFPDILLNNVIFCSGFFRKDDWGKVGGYNHEMIYGWEDYDFWLSIIELGREVHCIPDTLFYYRRKSGSMVEIMKEQHHVYSYTKMFKKHPNLYFQNIETVFSDLVSLRSRVLSFRSMLQKTQSELQKTQSELELAKYTIASMESSKFWRIRDTWFAIKRMLGVKTDD